MASKRRGPYVGLDSEEEEEKSLRAPLFQHLKWNNLNLKRRLETHPKLMRGLYHGHQEQERAEGEPWPETCLI